MHPYYRRNAGKEKGKTQGERDIATVKAGFITPFYFLPFKFYFLPFKHSILYNWNYIRIKRVKPKENGDL